MKTEEYIIRKVSPDDFLALHNVYLNTWLDTYPSEEFNITAEDIKYKFDSRLTLEKIEERKNKIANIGSNETMLLVERGKKVVALCNALNREDYNQLQAIYVLPEYQKLGFGKALWEEANKIFDSKKDIIVHVASYNENAIGFYKRLGFVSTEKIFLDEKHKMRNGAIIPELEMVIKRNKK